MKCLNKIFNVFQIPILILFIVTSKLAGQVGLDINLGTNVSLGNFELSISGDLINNGTLNADLGTIRFNGIGEQNLSSSSNQIFYNLIVDKSIGESLITNNNLIINGQLELNGGNLDLNGNTISLSPNANLIENLGSKIIGNSGSISKITDLNLPNSVDVGGLGLIISSGINLGQTSVSRGHTIQVGNGNQGISRYFDVSPTTNSSLNATLVFQYEDSELNGLLENELSLYESNDGGNNWTDIGGVVDEINNTITVSGINSLFRLTAGGTGNNSMSESADLTPSSLLSPTFVNAGQNYTPEILIENLSSTVNSQITTSKMEISFNGNLIYSDTQPIPSINSLSNTNLNFNSLTLYKSGTYQVKVITELLGDSNLSNDTLQTNFDVSGDVGINEFMNSGLSQYYQLNPAITEFFEIANTSSQPIDISGWTISNSVSQTITVSSFTLPPNDYSVFVPFNIPAFNGEIPFDYHYSQTFALNDVTDYLVVKDSNGNRVDSIFYDSSWQTVQGESFQRVDLTSDGNDLTNWCKGIFEYGTEGNKGTPGAETTCFPVVVNEFLNFGFSSLGLPNFVEFIELANISSQPIDISGWTIKNSSSQLITINSHTIPANDFSVLSPSSNAIVNGGTPFDYNFTETFSLDDVSDYIVLKDSNGNRVDSVSYDGSWTIVQGESFQKSEFNLDGNILTNWCKGVTSYGTEGNKGNPGNASTCFIIENLQIEKVGNDIVLNWNDKPNSILYKIYRSQTPFFSNAIQVGTFTPNGNQPSFTDSGIVLSGEKYFYFVIFEY